MFLVAFRIELQLARNSPTLPANRSRFFVGVVTFEPRQGNKWHFNEAGQSSGRDVHGAYASQYSRNSGETSVTDARRKQGWNGPKVVVNRKSSKYSNAQGTSQQLDASGFHTTGYKSNSWENTNRRDVMGQTYNGRIYTKGRHNTTGGSQFKSTNAGITPNGFYQNANRLNKAYSNGGGYLRINP